MEPPANGQISQSSDDAVHVDQAAKALDVSRRTVERMIERGELDRDTRHDSGAAVTKRSLVAALEGRRGATRQRVVASHDLASLLATIERLTETLAAERRQLTAASEERRRAEHEREEARIEAVQAEAELRTERARLDAEHVAAGERLQRLATAGWRERRRMLRELRSQALT